MSLPVEAVIFCKTDTHGVEFPQNGEGIGSCILGKARVAEPVTFPNDIRCMSSEGITWIGVTECRINTLQPCRSSVARTQDQYGRSGFACL